MWAIILRKLSHHTSPSINKILHVKVGEILNITTHLYITFNMFSHAKRQSLSYQIMDELKSQDLTVFIEVKRNRSFKGNKIVF